MEQENHTECGLYSVGNVNFLLTNGPDIISASLREGIVWEQMTLNFLMMLIEDIHSPVVVDIGANLGALSVPVGHAIKARGGTVYAFEPQRQVFYQLCANFFSNNLSNCYAYNMAVGDYCGEIDIPVLDTFECENLGALSLNDEIRKEQGWIKLVDKKEKVKITTLDALALPAAHVVKIDVEGFELEVLTGAKSWLAGSGNPPIVFEVWGDYMASMICRREKLLQTVKDELGYEYVLLGETCIAQHPDNKILNIVLNNDQYTVEKVPASTEM